MWHRLPGPRRALYHRISRGCGSGSLWCVDALQASCAERSPIGPESGTPQEDPMAETQSKPLNTEAVRSVLNAVARIIGTDRRPALPATENAEILLANGPA